MRILFLDFDGVLNSVDWAERRPSKEEFAREMGVSPERYDHDRLTWALRSVDPDAVAAHRDGRDGERLRRGDREAMSDEDECPGEGRCHGCMCWCDRCGDVFAVCDAEACARHRCSGCGRLARPRDRDPDLNFFCHVCDPEEYPRRWPATLVMLYAFSVVDRNPYATDTLHDLEVGINRIARGDIAIGEFHPARLARELGILRREAA